MSEMCVVYVREHGFILMVCVMGCARGKTTEEGGVCVCVCV